MKKNNQAFAPVIVLLVVAVALVFGGGAYYLGKTSKDVSETTTKSSISVVSPNGGESWTKGDNVKISWKAGEDIKFVNIRLNVLGNPDGQNFSATVASRVLNSGSYDWTVQDLYAEVLGVTGLPESNKYSISIEDSDNNSVHDSSDATFSINIGTVTANEKIYKDDRLGFEFKYPSKLSLTASGDMVYLSHSIPFENVGGGCDMRDGSEVSKTLTDFGLSIAIVSGDVKPSYIDGVYSKGVLNGQWSYMGAEGCGQTSYYFPISGNKTLIVTKSEVQMLSNSVTPDVKAKVLAVPGVISYEESKVILDQILSTVKFIDSNIPAENTTVQIYFSRSSGEAVECGEVAVVSRTIPKTTRVGKAALEELLKGPTTEEEIGGYNTDIPSGSKLNSLVIVNGEARADFNAVTEAGGGSCSMAARTNQIRRTLLQFPTVKTVVLSIDGRTKDIFQP